MNKLTQRKKAELKLIAELTRDATLAAEEKLSRLAGRTKTVSSSSKHSKKKSKLLKLKPQSA